MFRLTFLIVALTGFLLPVFPEQTKDKPAGRIADSALPATGNPFVVGEQLNYEVSWSDFVAAGELTLQIKERRSFDGVDAYHVFAQAQSVGVVSAMIYKVKDIYESFVDSETLKPFRAEKRTHHGKRYGQSSCTIDHERGVATLNNGKSLEVTPDTYDLASILYAVRTIDLTRGKASSFSVLEDDKLYRLRVEPEARVKAYTRAASFDAVRIAIRFIEGRQIRDPYRLRLYITPDSRRLPVLLTAEPPWGEIRVELTSATSRKADTIEKKLRP